MKKKKAIVMLIATIMLFSTVPILIQADETNQNITKKINLDFEKPQIQKEENFLSIRTDKTENYNYNNGAPQLPIKKIRMEFPFGTKITDIQFKHNTPQYMNLEQKIKPSPKQISYSTETQTEQLDHEIYNSKEYYPNQMSNYEIKVGRNQENEKTTYFLMNIYPIQYSPQKDKIKYITEADVEITYKEPETIQSFAGEDLLIITATAYQEQMQRLKNHKEEHGITTKIVTTEEINTNGRDLAEKIKKYIYQEDSPYVLLVGGYRDFFGRDNPELQLPLRWVDYTKYEPGFVSDLYFADTTYYNEETDSYGFDNWDTNNNGKYGENSWTAYDDLDLMPDVALGRLACRSVKEATTMVDKIINYENSDHTNQDWFNRILTSTGDDFQDLPDWDIYWDTSGLSGEYTIHAQTTNCDGISGNTYEVTITVDHNSNSQINFTQDDHKITDREYPYKKPIACITVPSEGNILGNTDVEVENIPGYSAQYVEYSPIEYKDGVLGIKGKAYDPRTQGGEDPARTNTSVRVWITKGGSTVEDWTLDSSCWFEGEHQAQMALDHFPNSFEKVKLWTSNGGLHGLEPSQLEPEVSPKVNGVKSMRQALDKGCGFMYVCGHACPISWADHYPGIPGGRALSDVAGFKVIQFPQTIFDLKDLFPMNKINNGDKLPIAVVSGCHPTSLDCSLLKALYDFDEVFGSDYGKFGPESLGWWLTRLDTGGSIATMGPTGLGFGAQGQYCDMGAGTRFWSNGFFRIYNEENMDILGDVYKETQSYYIDAYSPLSDVGMQTILEMVLLGDPTLKIGGYSSATTSFSSIPEEKIHAQPIDKQPVLKSRQAFKDKYETQSTSFANEQFQVTTNTLVDKKPETFTTDGAGSFIAGYSREVNTHSGPVAQNGFAVSEGGVEWKELLMTNGDEKIVHQDVSYAGVDSKAVGVDYNAIGTNFDIILMDDLINPDKWEVLTYYIPSGDIFDFGRNGVGVAAGYENDELTYHACFPANTTAAYDNLEQVPVFSSSYSNYIMWFPSVEHSRNVDMEAIHETGGSIFAFENPDGGYIGHIELVGGQYGIDIIVDQELSFVNPDVDAVEDLGIVVYQTENAIKSVTFSGLAWDTTQTVTMDGEKPEIVANEDGSFDCYYVKEGEIYKKHGEPSTTIPIDWGDEEKVTGISEYNTDDMFDAVTEGIIYPKTDENLYFFGELSTIESIDITEIKSDGEKPIVTIENTGTIEIEEDWTISVEGTNPFSIVGIPDIIRGRVFQGEETSGSLNLAVGETKTIEGDAVKGLGFCDVTATIGDNSETEDGFMIMDSLILHHKRE